MTKVAKQNENVVSTESSIFVQWSNYYVAATKVNSIMPRLSS